jgi:hypothetical protein
MNDPKLNRLNDWHNKQAKIIEENLQDLRDIIEAGSQFDYLLRQYQKTGHSFERVE